MRYSWCSWCSSFALATFMVLAVLLVACGEARLVPDPTEDHDAGEDQGTTLFLEPCATNEECETGLCFQFNARGRMCSKTCEDGNDCPPPSSGCNMMGVCKHSL